MELNNRIFQTLSEVAGSIDPTLTADHVRAMGLDPQGDRSFLVDLLEVYGFDVTLVIDNPCCPWVSPFLLWGTQNSIFTGYLCLLAPTPLHTYKCTHWALKTLPPPWVLHLLTAILCVPPLTQGYSLNIGVWMPKTHFAPEETDCQDFRQWRWAAVYSFSSPRHKSYYGLCHVCL